MICGRILVAFLIGLFALAVAGDLPAAGGRGMEDRDFAKVDALARPQLQAKAPSESTGGAAASNAPKPGEVWKEPLTGMELVWVPGGCYLMGCGPWTDHCYGDEEPVHEVCVDGFWMGKYEVTQAQWKRVQIFWSNGQVRESDGVNPGRAKNRSLLNSTPKDLLSSSFCCLNSN